MVTPEVISTVPNQTVTLQCTSSTPEAMCSFYRGGDVNRTSVIVTGEGGVDLQILSPRSSDAGGYVCRCMNSEGSSEDNGTIVCECIVCVHARACVRVCVHVHVCTCARGAHVCVCVPVSVCLSVRLSVSICAMCVHICHIIL